MHRRRTVSLVILVAAALATSALAQQAPSTGKPQGPALPEENLKVQTPSTYGIDSTSYYRMGASEFSPVSIPGTDNYSDTRYTFPGDSYRRYGTVANAYFLGTPHLPSGALVTGIYVHGCMGVTGGVNGDVNLCNYYGIACTVLASYTGVTGCGYDFIDMSSTGYVVDNSPLGSRLVIRLATVNTDGTDNIGGVTVAYKLQVSPAPGVATFNDVPTSDFGFQYIEALVASGITGGTGGGSYSPNAFVTRRQMAIFISKALGLHFP